MPVGSWTIAGAAIVVAVLAALLYRTRREARRLRTQVETASTDLQHLQLSFARFAPDALVEHIISRGMPDEGEQKEVTVLFADLVGFTPLAERIEPSRLVRILNGYFERMSHAITDQHGYVSTFVGDGILALFGALEPNPWQGNDAVLAALEMRTMLRAYNEQLRRDGLPPLAMGIGLHRGTGVVGLVGSGDKKEFTLVGRTINVAARVSDLTREYDTDILVTGDLQRTLAPQFELRALPPARLRGIAEDVPVYAVERYDAQALGTTDR